MKQLFLAILFFIPLSLMAQSDPWNTYQWNRKNVQAGNGVVDKTLW